MVQQSVTNWPWLLSKNPPPRSTMAIIDNNDIATRQFQIINSVRIEGKGEKEGKSLMLSVSDDDCESNYENKMARISLRSSAYIVDQSNHEFINENQLNPRKKFLLILQNKNFNGKKKSDISTHISMYFSFSLANETSFFTSSPFFTSHVVPCKKQNANMRT